MYTNNKIPSPPFKDGYYIRNDDKRGVLKARNFLHVSGMNIKTLVLPEGCSVVYCHNNNIKELIIPKGCQYVSCDYFTKIINPENCEYICYYF